MPFIADPTIEITVLAVVATVISLAIQHRFFHRKEMLQSQEDMRHNQKRMMELMKKEDKKSKEEAQKIQQDMMDQTFKMLNPMQMVAQLVVFAPLLWYFHAAYDGMAIALPFPFPWWVDGFVWLNQTNWFGWYFLTVMVFMIVLTPLEKKLFK